MARHHSLCPAELDHGRCLQPLRLLSASGYGSCPLPASPPESTPYVLLVCLLCSIVIEPCEGRVEYHFVELEPFTRKVVQLDLEDDLRVLQHQLRENPTAGVLDPGTCGLRKVRVTVSKRGRGKRYGARVHYLHFPGDGMICLFNLYLKEEQSALTPAQKRRLCAFVDLLTET